MWRREFRCEAWLSSVRHPQADGIASHARILASDESTQAEPLSTLCRRHSLDNDTNFALLGERHFGAARRAANAAMFTLGAGIMIDGRLIRGTHGLELDSPADIFQPNDNELLTTLRLQFEQALLVALTAAVVSCDPDVIVLGGAIASSLETRIDSLKHSLAQALRTNARIATADLGDLSGALGAAVQALHRVFAALGIPDDALSRMPPQRPLRTGHLNAHLSAPS